MALQRVLGNLQDKLEEAQQFLNEVGPNPENPAAAKAA
jgi:hypothetical protein